VLHVNELLKIDHPDDIRHRLGRLPKDLKETYQEILATIQLQDGIGPKIADRAFKWMMAAYKPLSAKQLLVAAFQDPDKQELNQIPAGFDINFVLKACRNLLVVETVNTYGRHFTECRFAHLSVQEFLENKDGNVEQSRLEAHCAVARGCLSLLLNCPLWDDRCIHHQDTSNDTNDKKSKSYALVAEDAPSLQYCNDCGPLVCLFPYIISFWPAHCRICDIPKADIALSTSLKTLLGSMEQSSAAFRKWVESVDSFQHGLDAQTGFTHDLKPSSSPVYAICFLGFFHLLSDWWRTCTFDVRAKNTEGVPLLRLSIRGSKTALVERIIELGADVKLQDSEGDTALHYACNNARVDTVHMLLQWGADVNSQNTSGKTALHKVCGQETFLERGRELKSEAERLEMDEALFEARAGRLHMVKVLLEAGADAKIKDSVGLSPCEVAFETGQTQIMNILLEAGTKGIISQEIKNNSLRKAIDGYWGEAAIQFYLAEGADPNWCFPNCPPALHSACEIQAGAEMVKLLLKGGADIEAKAASGAYAGQTALHVACQTGNAGILRVLIDAGANVNAKGESKETAYQQAYRETRHDIVEMLEKAGADIAVMQRDKDEALHYAIGFSDREEVLKYLAHGANVNAEVNERTAYQQAMRHHDKHIAQILRDHGAAVEEKDKIKIPYHAISGKKKTVVLMSLKESSDVKREGDRTNSVGFWRRG
jgi:ankyrin repeat protein